MSMHMPQKALLFYCPSTRPNTQFPTIDQIASKGGSGRIALEIESSDSNQTVLQLLGLFDTIDIKSEFKQRFNDMSLAIITNDPHTIQLARQLDCHYEPISTQLQMHRLSCNVIFVDFTGVPSQDAWSTLDTLASQHWGSNVIQCVISSSSTTHNMLERHPPWWASIRPRQSYLLKNGTPLASVQDKTLFYSYLHAGSSRQDSVSTFTESDIQAHGCNGTILAWHLLAEIGHKLGFVPKYGA